jgi:pimeloyl-ACP methyl ester carboxylesterase
VRLAFDHPELVKSCVIADGVSLYPGIGRDHIVRANPPRPLHSRDSIRWILERQCYSPASVTEEWVGQMFEIAKSEKNRAAVRKMNDQGLLRTAYIPGMGKLLGPTHRQLREKGLKCPTLLTWSLDDPVGDVSNGRLLVEMFQEKQPNTEVRYFNKVGHYSFREQPKHFTHMLKHYLAAL